MSALCTVQNRFKCRISGCTSSFQRKEHRNRHEGQHTGALARECPLCARTFSRRCVYTNLVRGIRSQSSDLLQATPFVAISVLITVRTSQSGYLKPAGPVAWPKSAAMEALPAVAVPPRHVTVSMTTAKDLDNNETSKCKYQNQLTYQKHRSCRKINPLLSLPSPASKTMTRPPVSPLIFTSILPISIPFGPSCIEPLLIPLTSHYYSCRLSP